MSTDRELLELAAKAEGHGVEFCKLTGHCWYENKFTGLIWEPLHNDGDAFRLAVKLRLHIKQYVEAVEVFEHWNSSESLAFERYKGDPAAAVRLAITSAAAELWRRKIRESI